MTSHIELFLDSTVAVAGGGLSSSILNHPKFTIGRQVQKVKSLKIIEVEIPFSYYVFNNGVVPGGFFQNRLIFNWGSVGLNSDQVSISITPGNYSGSSFATALQTSLLAQLATFGLALGNPITMTNAAVTYSSSTGKITVVLTGVPFTPQPTMNVYVPSGTLVQPLATSIGTNGNTNNPSSAYAAGAWTLTFPYVANFSGPNYLYVNSLQLGTNIKGYLPQGVLGANGETNPPIAQLACSANPGDVIWWQDPAPEWVFDSQNLYSLDNLDFYITAGTDKEPLDFNGLGFSIKLLVEVQDLSDTKMFQGSVDQDRIVKRFRAT